MTDARKSTISCNGHLTVGEFREMTADLDDDVEIVLALPGPDTVFDTTSPDSDWHRSGLDISVSGPNFDGRYWEDQHVLICADGWWKEGR